MGTWRLAPSAGILWLPGLRRGERREASPSLPSRGREAGPEKEEFRESFSASMSDLGEGEEEEKEGEGGGRKMRRRRRRG